jgi:hypothetical protein
VSAAARPDRAPTLAELVRIATDFSPAAANEGADRVLGAVADGLDPALPAHRHALAIATAAMCFVAMDGEPRSPYAQLLANRPIPPIIDRARVRAAALAPWAPWRVVAVEPGGARLTSCAGLADPDQAVPIDGPFVPAAVGTVVYARLVVSDAGITAVTAIAIDGASDAQLASWQREPTPEARVRRAVHWFAGVSRTAR